MEKHKVPNTLFSDDDSVDRVLQLMEKVKQGVQHLSILLRYSSIMNGSIISYTHSGEIPRCICHFSTKNLQYQILKRLMFTD